MKFLSIDLYFPTIHFSTFQFYFHSFHSCTTTIPTTDSDNWLHPFPIHLLNDKNRKIKRMSWRWRPFSFIYFLLFFILFTHNQILSCSDHFIFFHCNWHGLKRMKRGSSLFIIRPLSFRLKSAFPFLFWPIFLDSLFNIYVCVTDRKRQTKEGEGYSDVIIDEPFFEGGMRIVFTKTTSSAPLLRAVSFIFRPSILASHWQTKTHVFSSFKRILVANKGDSSVKNSSPCQHTYFYFFLFDFLIFFCTLENVVLQRLKKSRVACCGESCDCMPLADCVPQKRCAHTTWHGPRILTQFIKINYTRVFLCILHAIISFNSLEKKKREIVLGFFGFVFSFHFFLFSGFFPKRHGGGSGWARFKQLRKRMWEKRRKKTNEMNVRKALTQK